jgi:hypothetical protein
VDGNEDTGSDFFLRAIALMQSAARLAIALNNFLLSQKKFQSSEGMVNVICCHDVFGSMSYCFWIQTSVAFFPQDEQPLLLQVKQMYLT